MSNPTIQAVRNTESGSYYQVTFETLPDRTRWCLKNGFTFDPSELYGARWTSTHNGSDFTRWLEMVPLADDLCHNPRALCLKVYLHAYSHSSPAKCEGKSRRIAHGPLSSQNLALPELDYNAKIS